MATNADRLLSEIRALPDEEKLRLLDMILTDMDTPNPEIDQIWANEARKRWKAYHAGRLKTVSYEELIRRYKRLRASNLPIPFH
jgi:putative addiction module component (TIGR02574 family)